MYGMYVCMELDLDTHSEQVLSVEYPEGFGLSFSHTKT